MSMTGDECIDYLDRRDREMKYKLQARHTGKSLALHYENVIEQLEKNLDIAVKALKKLGEFKDPFCLNNIPCLIEESSYYPGKICIVLSEKDIPKVESFIHKIKPVFVEIVYFSIEKHIKYDVVKRNNKYFAEFYSEFFRNKWHYGVPVHINQDTTHSDLMNEFKNSLIKG
jgi:hypothetical protein